MRRSLTKLIVLSIPLTLLYYGCFDKPGDLVAPSWDVEMNIPLMNKTYTLKDIIEKDSSLDWYPAGSQSANQIYYADRRPIESVTIGDNVKLDNIVPSVTSQSIGEIKIENPAEVNSNINFDFDPSIQPGAFQTFPSQNNSEVTVTLPAQNQYNYIVLSSGAVSVSLKNNLPAPIDITLSNISLENKFNTVAVGNYSGTVLIPAGQTRNITINLKPGIQIYNQLVMNCLISTPGSGATLIQIPQTAFNINASFTNLVVTEVRGKLQGNTVTSSSTVEVDQQTKYTDVEIDSGTLRLAIKNGIDVGFNAKLKLNNLYADRNSTTPFELNIRVERNSDTYINQPLSNFILKSNSPSSAITYELVVNTDATNDFRTIKSTNSFTDTVTISNLSIRRFNGIVKPTKIDITPTTISLNLRDLKDKFKFDKINFKNPEINIYMKPSSQFKIKFDGEISAKGTSSKLTFSDYISRSSSQVDSVITIPSQALANFLSSFTPNIPEELYISGSATVNPDYEQQVYSFSKTDSVTGSAEIKFPLNIGIDNGRFTDTTDYAEDIKDAKDDIEKIQSVYVTLEITNGIPANVRFAGSVMDAAMKNKLMELPPNRPQPYLDIPAAKVDNNGKVTAPSTITEKIEIKGGDVEKFLNGKFMLSNVTLNTSGAVPGNPLPVEFKITDAIKIKVSGKVAYKVSDD